MSKSLKVRTGKTLAVDPIQSREHVAQIKRMLKAKSDPRDYALFVFGINTALRACDLRRLTFHDVQHLKLGDPWTFRERKTGKVRKFVMNRDMFDAKVRLINSRPDLNATSPLFIGYQGKPLCGKYINLLVQEWCRAVGITYRVGAHTLRKTFGYQKRVYENVDFAVLHEIYGHSSIYMLKRYLCVTDAELLNIHTDPI